MKKLLGTPPKNKKEYIQLLGKQLISDVGKKEYYQIVEVIEADDKIDYINKQEIPWWGISIFSTYDDFEELYKQEFEGKIEEDKKVEMQNVYKEIRNEILIEIASASISNLDGILDINLDASWLELGELSDSIFETISEFFSAIIEGIF